MPRFELKDGNLHRFWSIELEDESFTMHFGDVGTEGSRRTRKFKDAWEAEARQREAIAQMVGNGYVEVGEGPPVIDETGPDGKLFINPSDLGAYAKAAEGLKAAGDPLGELMVLGVQMDIDGQAAAKKKWKELLHKNREVLYGGLPEADPAVVYEFRCGVLRSIVFKKDDRKNAEANLVERLRLVNSAPIARYLEELEIEDIPSASGAIEALCTGVKATLRTLRLNSHYTTVAQSRRWTDIGAVHLVYHAFPRLTCLEMTGQDVRPGLPQCPTLLQFSFRTSRLSDLALNGLIQAQWPRLERIELWLGDRAPPGIDEWSGDIWRAEDEEKGVVEERANGRAQKILSCVAESPRIREIVVRNAWSTDAMFRVLHTHPLLPQLRVLDMAYGNFDAMHVEALLAIAPAFAHLEVINLGHNFLDAASIKRLQAALPNLVAADQEDKDEYVTKVIAEFRAQEG